MCVEERIGNLTAMRLEREGQASEIIKLNDKVPHQWNGIREDKTASAGPRDRAPKLAALQKI